MNQSFTPNIKLQNISVEFNLRCKIKQEKKSFEKSFTVLKFVGQDTSLQSYFFNLCNNLLENLGNSPTQSEARVEIHQIIELLRFVLEPPQKTAQGLWAELFLISISFNPSTLVDCWHSTPQEKFDFNNGREIIEVKSSSSGLRIHNFSIEQLNPPQNTKVFIASLFVVSSINGISIQDLERKITDNISQDALIKKLRLLIAKTLGNSIREANSLKFDSLVAKNSLRFYPVEDIPKISLPSVPSEVSEVKFKSNLENVQPVNYSRILKNYFS